MKKALLIFALVFIFAGCSNDRLGGEATKDPVTPPSEKKQEPPKQTNQQKEKTMQTIEDLNLKDLAKEYSHATIVTNMGNIKVKLYGEESPVTVNNFLNLAQQGFFDGTRFHRCIDNFMIQGGDPLSKDESKKDMWGTGGPGYKFNDEFNDHKLVRGSLAMANSGPNTNGSQFFIVTAEATPWLDGKHTNFGEVVEDGMYTIDGIDMLETDGRDQPLSQVLVNRIELHK